LDEGFRVYTSDVHSKVLKTEKNPNQILKIFLNNCKSFSDLSRTLNHIDAQFFDIKNTDQLQRLTNLRRECYLSQVVMNDDFKECNLYMEDTILNQFTQALNGITTTNQENKDLRSALRSSEGKMKHFQSNFIALQAEKKIWEGKIEELEQAIEAYKINEAKQKEAARTAAHVKNQDNQIINSYQRQLTTLNEENKEYIKRQESLGKILETKNLTQLNQTASGLTEKIQAVTENNKNLLQDLREEKRKLAIKDKEVEELKRRLTTGTEQNESLTAQIAELRTASSEESDEKTLFTEQLENLRSELTTERSNLEAKKRGVQSITK